MHIEARKLVEIGKMQLEDFYILYLDFCCNISQNNYLQYF